MNYTRLALVLAFSALCSTQAMAASVTMLQFGSFETRVEAEKRLSEVASKHGGDIGNLPTAIREIKLPPDNLTVYRTQAGPVESRSVAQSICSKLAATGDECYIVQTAMVPTEVPALAAAVSAPVQRASELKANLEKSAAETSASLASRDAASRAALSSVNGADLATTNAAPMPAAASPEVSKALDKAIADQPQADAEITAATTKQVEASKSGFWSRLNPFGPKNTASEVAAPVAPSPAAAPVEDVASEALAAPVVVTPVIATPVVATPVVVESVSPVTQPSPVLVAPAPMLSAAPIAALPAPMLLPPPPAPLKAQDVQALNAPKTVARPESIAVSPNPPMIGKGAVNVEEAKRVPVVAPVMTTPPVAKPGVVLSPSASEGMKTIWVQAGPFSSNEAALAYWANYRQNNPDFPVVRVRVTSPYIQKMHGNSQTWLRVGPMAQVAFVKNLCATLVPNDAAHPSDLRCGAVSDLGISSPLTSAPGMLPGSRYKR